MDKNLNIPKWLASVRKNYGDTISEEDASSLYRPQLDWDTHNKLCQKGSFSQIISEISNEDHPVEKEVLFISSFNMLDQHRHPELAIEIGYRYLLEFTNGASSFRPDSSPPVQLLKKLAVLYDQAGQFEHAIWVCDVATHFGISDDGTKSGFSGRRKRLEKLADQKHTSLPTKKSLSGSEGTV